jgi:hypothetical protein
MGGFGLAAETTGDGAILGSEAELVAGFAVGCLAVVEFVAVEFAAVRFAAVGFAAIAVG